MKLFSRHEWSKAFSRFLARRGFVKVPNIGGAAGYSFGGWSNLGSPGKQMEAFRGHVYKCVNLISNRAIAIPMHLYKAGPGHTEISRHVFLDLMLRPNPYMTGSNLKGLTFIHRDLTGMAFWYVPRNGLGRPSEIWPLCPADFQRFVLSEDKTELLGYEFRTDGGKVERFDREEILYFHYPHPRHYLLAASPIQAMAYEYDTDMAIRVYERNFFQNSARPDVVLETDQEIQAEDARRLLLAWNASHQGVDRSWGTAILDRGLKANVLSVSPRDMEFANLARLTKQDIMEAYNVPPGKLGTVEDVNRANAVGIDITFNSECIRPRLMSYEDEINLNLLPLYDKGLRVQHENCIPRDLDYELRERDLNLRMYVTTINEERAEMGLDSVSWGSVPWVSIASFEYGETPGIIQEPEAIQEAQGGKPNAQSEEKRPGAAQIRLLHERRVAARSRAFRSYLRKYFKGQEARVLRNLEQFGPRVEGALSGMAARKTGAWLEQHKDQVDRINFLLEPADQELKENATPFIQATLIDGAGTALGQVGAGDVVFDLFSPRAIRFMAEKEMQIRRINRQTHDEINQALREGFEAGDTTAQIAGRIRRDVFRQADQVRALRIAQTEINSAANAGTQLGYLQSGVVEKKEWIAGPGARPSHAAAAAKYRGSGAIPIDQDFEVGAGRGPSPGNIGRPEEDINCRCTILPVLGRRRAEDGLD